MNMIGCLDTQTSGPYLGRVPVELDDDDWRHPEQEDRFRLHTFNLWRADALQTSNSPIYAKIPGRNARLEGALTAPRLAIE